MTEHDPYKFSRFVREHADALADVAARWPVISFGEALDRDKIRHAVKAMRTMANEYDSFVSKVKQEEK